LSWGVSAGRLQLDQRALVEPTSADEIGVGHNGNDMVVHWRHGAIDQQPIAIIYSVRPACVFRKRT
jgi:hypothetical protein